MKTSKGIRVRSITCNTSGVKRRVGAPRWGLKRVVSKSIIHMDMHKPNNKMVNA